MESATAAAVRYLCCALTVFARLLPIPVTFQGGKLLNCKAHVHFSLVSVIAFPRNTGIHFINLRKQRRAVRPWHDEALMKSYIFFSLSFYFYLRSSAGCKSSKPHFVCFPYNFYILSYDLGRCPRKIKEKSRRAHACGLYNFLADLLKSVCLLRLIWTSCLVVATIFFYH